MKLPLPAPVPPKGVPDELMIESSSIRLNPRVPVPVPMLTVTVYVLPLPVTLATDGVVRPLLGTTTKSLRSTPVTLSLKVAV